MDRLVRLGRVSSIDPNTKMISVTYPDLDDSVTSYLSVLSHGDEYKALSIGDEVITLHFPSGQNRAVVLGRYWNKSNIPVSDGVVYRKELGKAKGEAYISYDGTDITLHSPKGSITVQQILNLISRISALEG